MQVKAFERYFPLILLTNRDEKIIRKRVFDCHLSPEWRQISIEKLFLAIFDLSSSIVKSVFDCRISGVVMLCISDFGKVNHFNLLNSKYNIMHNP